MPGPARPANLGFLTPRSRGATASRSQSPSWPDALVWVPVDPFLFNDRSVVAQFNQQIDRIISPNQGIQVLFLDESLLSHVVKELEKTGIILLHIQEGAWLRMDSELCPGENLEDLFNCPYPTGKRDKGVGKLRHLQLPF